MLWVCLTYTGQRCMVYQRVYYSMHRGQVNKFEDRLILRFSLYSGFYFIIVSLSFLQPLSYVIHGNDLDCSSILYFFCGLGIIPYCSEQWTAWEVFKKRKASGIKCLLFPPISPWSPPLPSTIVNNVQWCWPHSQWSEGEGTLIPSHR
jgi:hypothetical protein